MVQPSQALCLSRYVDADRPADQFSFLEHPEIEPIAELMRYGHLGQRRYSGAAEYRFHPMAVGRDIWYAGYEGEDRIAKVQVALGHDLLEGTWVTERHLGDVLPAARVGEIVLMSNMNDERRQVCPSKHARTAEEAYPDYLPWYIDRQILGSGNHNVKVVKRADVNNNWASDPFPDWVFTQKPRKAFKAELWREALRRIDLHLLSENPNEPIVVADSQKGRPLATIGTLALHKAA